MIDMHNHILFGLDDGAKTYQESIELIKEQISKGVTHIIFTPHYKKRGGELDKGKTLQRFKELKEISANEKLDIQLYLGNEVYFDSDFYENLEYNSFYTLADSDYILVELSMMDTPKNIPEICYEIKLRGYIPIIAHVERYNCFYENTELLKDVLNEGAHLQVNASAIINKESKESNKFVKYLLQHELISFVASDVHNMEDRSFHLDKAYNYVKKSYSSIYADKIFSENQQNILLNKYFDSPKAKPEKRGFLSKLFRYK